MSHLQAREFAKHTKLYIGNASEWIQGQPERKRRRWWQR
jgi:hypothetical protein